jgi:FtsX-like permease family
MRATVKIGLRLFAGLMLVAFVLASSPGFLRGMAHANDRVKSLALKERNLQLIKTNGIRLRAVVEGKGPLVILLHGFPYGWYLWHFLKTVKWVEVRRSASRTESVALAGGRFADVGLIVGSITGAVVFTLVLLTGNVMAQAVRERIPEIAILKTIGFTARSVMGLVLGESVLLLMLGAVLGLAIATAVVAGVRLKLGPTVPMLPVAGTIWLRGLTLAGIIGLVAGPCRHCVAYACRLPMHCRVAEEEYG